jgi:uncharacterized protein (DUF302 family)
MKFYPGEEMATEYRVKSERSFDEVCDKIREVVPLNGFSILSEIRTSDILRSKGFEYPNLRTFDICNAKYAHEALSFDYRVETLIPCHIIAKSVEGGTEVSVQLPAEIFHTLQTDKTEPMTAFLNEVETKLKTIVDSFI